MEGEERSNTNNNDNINNNDNNLNIDGNINSESDDKNNINNNSITENIPEKIEENKEDNEKDENISNNNNKNNLENKENEQEIEKEIAKKDLENNEEDLTKNEPEKDEEKEEKDEKDEKDEIEIDINNKSPPDLSKPENIVFSPSLRTEAKHPTSSSPSDVTFINTLLQSNQEDEIIYSSGEFSNFSPYSSSEMATSSLRPSSLTKNSEKASTESSNIGQSLPTSPSRKLRDKSVVLDPQMVEQIEQNARNLAQNVDHLIGSLSSSLHAISTISTSYMENYQKAADSLGDATANGVAGMYSFLNKIKQLNSNLSEVDRIADEVKEIKKVVDVMEYFAFKYTSE